MLSLSPVPGDTAAQCICGGAWSRAGRCEPAAQERSSKWDLKSSDFTRGVSRTQWRHLQREGECKGEIHERKSLAHTGEREKKVGFSDVHALWTHCTYSHRYLSTIKTSFHHCHPSNWKDRNRGVNYHSFRSTKLSIFFNLIWHF